MANELAWERSKSWQGRLLRAIKDVTLPIEGWRGLMVRLLSWLALLGLPVAAAFSPDDVLPPTVGGKILVGLAVAGALTSGIQANFRLRARIDAYLDDERAGRDLARRAVCSAIVNMSGAFFRLQSAIVAFSTGKAGGERAIPLAGAEFQRHLDAYRDASAGLSITEAALHGHLQAQIRTAADAGTDDAFAETGKLVALANEYVSQYGGTPHGLHYEEMVPLARWAEKVGLDFTRRV